MTGDQAPREIPVVVVGGGQAGLSMSWLLTRRGTEHVVLERATVAHSWADARWDTFCLVTPNWQCRLPGWAYTGPDPDGFLLKDEIVTWLADYRASFDPPTAEHTAVTAVRRREDGRFDVEATGQDGPVRLVAGAVVVATGGYHTPRVPRLAERLPDALVQVHSSAYTGPGQLPAGDVLVVGTGQSGAQIAEDLHRAGRGVHLAVGSAPRVARRYRGRDVVAWLEDMGHYDRPVTDKPLAERFADRTNHYVTGRDGGHDIDLRAFAREGMALHGHLVAVEGAGGSAVLRFADDLERHLDAADAVSEGIKDAIDGHVAERGLDAPLEPRYTPVWRPGGEGAAPLDLASPQGAAISGVVWATGFASDYRWLEVPVFDGAGHVRHDRGVSTTPGLVFLGLPWLHTWGSGRFAGVARDAAHLDTHLAEHLAATGAGLVPVPA